VSNLLTSTQAAAVVGVKPVTIRKYLAEGLIPSAYFHGRDWVIPEAALAELRRRKPGRKPTHKGGAK